MARQVNKQEDRHAEGSKRKQGKKETEGGQEPTQDPCVGLQGSARPGQAVLQPVREKDVKLGALARSGARFSATFARAMAALELLAGAARASRESNGLSFRKRQ